MASPEGLMIGPAKKAWEVGKVLGKGGCAAVYTIQPTSQQRKTKYAVKVAPLPARPANKKKRKKNQAEINADLIMYERSLYVNIFSALRGKYIPDIPQVGDPISGSENGYAYFILERMESPLTDVIPTLIKEQKKTGSISLGDVAVAILSCVEAFHRKGFVCVDIKMDNFMLAFQKSAKQSLSDRVRMIDLALAETYTDSQTGKVKADTFPEASFIGTPSFASINVHRGHKLTRRDDVEAVGYVIADLLLCLEAALASKAPVSHPTSLLPWRNAKSDVEVLVLKERFVEGEGDEFFPRMGRGGNDSVSKLMKRYFDVVRKMKYAEAPDLSALKGIVKLLSVKAPKATTAKHSSSSAGRGSLGTRSSVSVSRDTHTDNVSKSPTRKRPSPKSATNDSFEFDEDAPVLRRSGRRKAARASNATEIVKVRDETDVIVVEDDDQNTTFHTCEDETSSMDWEVIPDDNVIEDASKENEPTNGFKFEIVSGPHKGELFYLSDKVRETLVIGKEPQLAKCGRAKYPGVYTLDRDNSLAGNHVKLVLRNRRGVRSVTVQDMKGPGGVEVSGQPSPVGKDRMIYSGDKMSFGSTTVQILWFGIKEKLKVM